MMNSLQPSELHQPTFSEGFNASLKAIVYILQHPILLFYTFLALLINGAIIGLLLWWGWDRSDLILPLLKQYAFLKSIFLLLKFVLLIVIIYFVVPILFASLLNLNPIAAFLASEMFKIVFKNETGQAFVEVDSFFVGLPKMLWAELRKLIAPLILMILAFSLHLVPVIGSIASMIAFFLIGIQFAGWSYVTPYMNLLVMASKNNVLRCDDNALGYGVLA